MISAFGVEHGHLDTGHGGRLAKLYSEERVATPAEKAKAIGPRPGLHPLKRRKAFLVYADDDGNHVVEPGTPGHLPATTLIRPGQKGHLL